MLIRAAGILCAARHHGEHGVIARVMTAEHGLLAGYARAGRSSRMRPILIAGNDVAGEWRARTEDQLPSLTAELLHSRAPLLAEPLAAAAMDWATALTAAAMPEGQPFPPVFAALQALLDAV
ncbi:MAG: recombination protein O N-terminal domain-containing protein, partial [Sphingopyxis sp.]